MNSYYDFELFAPGMTANTYTVNDNNHWVIQGITAKEPVFEDNFDADIAAIADEYTVGFDDSGYYSNSAESFEASNDDGALYNGRPPTPTLPTTQVLHPTTFYPDAPASSKSNHASIHKGTKNKSTSHISRHRPDRKKSKEPHLSKTVYHPVHESEHKTPHKYSTVAAETNSPSLDIWVATHERHEKIACGNFDLMQQPGSSSGKRRKNASKK